MAQLTEPYRHIGLDLYSDITDLFYAKTGLPDAEIQSAISRGQIYSKQWMVQELEPYLPMNANVVIVGSWIGLGARLLLERFSERIASVTCIEFDARMKAPTWHLNHPYSDKFTFLNADIFKLDFHLLVGHLPRSSRVFINCSCDNIDSTERYVDEITHHAAINLLQQNNYQSPRSHLSVDSLKEFEAQIRRLRNPVYLDTMSFPMYDRYMVISQT